MSQSLCVYCRQRPAVAPWQPFCGERCKMADLGRWLGGTYRLPAEELAAPTDGDVPDEASPNTPHSEGTVARTYGRHADDH